MPGTKANIAWNPTTGQYEGDLSRSWLSGPVNLQVTLKRPDGSEFTIKWNSVDGLEEAAKARQQEAQVIQAAVSAALQTLRSPLL